MTMDASRKGETGVAQPAERVQPLRGLNDLLKRFDELTGSQKRIVEYVVRNPDKVAFMNLDKLADAINVSPSTIVRFCYKLDYDGYTDMQGQLQTWVLAQLNQESESSAALADRTDSGVSLFYQAMDHDLRTMQESLRTLRPDLIKRAVELMLKGRQIRVVGFRSAYSVAHALSLGLNKVLGNTGLVEAPDGTMPEQMLQLGAGDLLIAITFPRYSSLTVDIARLARERGCRVIAITDSIVSPLARIADLVLPSAYRGIGVQNSLTATFSMVHGLISTVEEACQESYQERIRATEELVARWNMILLRQREGTDRDGPEKP